MHQFCVDVPGTCLSSILGFEPSKRSLPRVIWLLLSDEQMGKKMQFSPLNDEQTSNWLGVKHLPVMYTGVSKNNGTPKSSILIGFSIINYPFWVPLYLEISIYMWIFVILSQDANFAHFWGTRAFPKNHHLRLSLDDLFLVFIGWIAPGPRIGGVNEGF